MSQEYRGSDGFKTEGLGKLLYEGSDVGVFVFVLFLFFASRESLEIN